jgi:hypothetical protein
MEAADKLKRVELYSQFINELSTQYYSEYSNLYGFPCGFRARGTGITSVKYISEEEHCCDAYRLSCVYVLASDGLHWPKEATGYFPLFIFDDLSEEELKSRTYQFFFQKVKKNLKEGLLHLGGFRMNLFDIELE